MLLKGDVACSRLTKHKIRRVRVKIYVYGGNFDLLGMKQA